MRYINIRNKIFSYFVNHIKFIVKIFKEKF